MLELRPTCERCGKALPPAATDARICSFECTFCDDCADGALANVCPNCAGGLYRRPVRPARDWKNGNFLGAFPASTSERQRAVDPREHAALVAAVGHIPPHER